MKIKLATSLLLMGTFLTPLAAYAADASVAATKPTFKEVVKDSVITTKVKTQLAAHKFSSAFHIKVETDENGFVMLSGTAKTQAEIDSASSIATNVSGVSFVQNSIQLAATPMQVIAEHGEQRVEERIKDMHAKLKITSAQEELWGKVAQIMRDNETQMDALIKTRVEKANMSAIDDLNSYGDIADAHADSIKKFTPIFKSLYDSMPDAQKKTADDVFRHAGRKTS